MILKSIPSIKVFNTGLALVFFSTSIMASSGFCASATALPVAGSLLNVTPAFDLPVLKGVKFDPANPLKLDFIVDSGDFNASKDTLKSESEKLIRYFLAALTIPESDLWVNLSPYEKDRVIPDALSLTDMGEGLLAQDYILKQLSASLTYPESPLGKKFWDTVYKRSRELYGTSKIPINTFNKVWIIPESADIYADGDKAFVTNVKLGVMMEGDYLAMKKQMKDEVRQFVKQIGETSPSAGWRGRGLPDGKAGMKDENAKADKKTVNGQKVNDLSGQIMKEIILPVIKEEVNNGKQFAQLRQICYSLVLAAWFKQRLRAAVMIADEKTQMIADKNNGLNRLNGRNELNIFNQYIDQKKTNGIDTSDPAYKEQVYQRYLQAYKKGAYDYLKKECEAGSRKQVRRKYFSGGITGSGVDTITSHLKGPFADASPFIDSGVRNRRLSRLPINFQRAVTSASPAQAAASPAALFDQKRHIKANTGVGVKHAEGDVFVFVGQSDHRQIWCCFGNADDPRAIARAENDRKFWLQFASKLTGTLKNRYESIIREVVEKSQIPINGKLYNCLYYLRKMYEDSKIAQNVYLRLTMFYNRLFSINNIKEVKLETQALDAAYSLLLLEINRTTNKLNKLLETGTPEAVDSGQSKILEELGIVGAGGAILGEIITEVRSKIALDRPTAAWHLYDIAREWAKKTKSIMDQYGDDRAKWPSILFSYTFVSALINKLLFYMRNGRYLSNLTLTPKEVKYELQRQESLRLEKIMKDLEDTPIRRAVPDDTLDWIYTAMTTAIAREHYHIINAVADVSQVLLIIQGVEDINAKDLSTDQQDLLEELRKASPGVILAVESLLTEILTRTSDNVAASEGDSIAIVLGEPTSMDLDALLDNHPEIITVMTDVGQSSHMGTILRSRGIPMLSLARKILETFPVGQRVAIFPSLEDNQGVTHENIVVPNPDAAESEHIRDQNRREKAYAHAIAMRHAEIVKAAAAEQRKPYIIGAASPVGVDQEIIHRKDFTGEGGIRRTRGAWARSEYLSEEDFFLLVGQPENGDEEITYRLYDRSPDAEKETDKNLDKLPGDDKHTGFLFSMRKDANAKTGERGDEGYNKWRDQIKTVILAQMRFANANLAILAPQFSFPEYTEHLEELIRAAVESILNDEIGQFKKNTKGQQKMDAEAIAAKKAEIEAAANKLGIHVMIESKNAVSNVKTIIDALAAKFGKHRTALHIGMNDLGESVTGIRRADTVTKEAYDRVMPLLLGNIEDVLTVADQEKVPVVLCGNLASDSIMRPIAQIWASRFKSLPLLILAVPDRHVPETISDLHFLSGKADAISESYVKIEDGVRSSRILELARHWNRLFRESIIQSPTYQTRLKELETADRQAAEAAGQKAPPASGRGDSGTGTPASSPGAASSPTETKGGIDLDITKIKLNVHPASSPAQAQGRDGAMPQINTNSKETIDGFKNFSGLTFSITAVERITDPAGLF